MRCCRLVAASLKSGVRRSTGMGGWTFAAKDNLSVEEVHHIEAISR